MAEYGRVTAEVLSDLEGIVGRKNLISSGEELEKYAVDESPLGPHLPEAVVKPASTAEVSAVMRLASMLRIPVTPMGARTGLSGGSHPVRGGLALSTERMNRIIEIDQGNLMATVEPGVLISEVHEATEKLGLYYPPDPGQDSGSIGGNVSTNAGGMRGFKYGVTRDFVQALEVVMPSGEVVNVGGKTVKDSTGYSLIDLIIGSEGTLCIVTRVTLRLIPKPRYTTVIYAPYNSVGDAARTVAEIIRRKIVPFGLEYMPRHAVETVERYLEKKMPEDTHPAYLIVGFEANSQEELSRELEEAGEVCLGLGAVDAYIADTAEKQRQIWEGRKAVFDAYLALYDVDEADICVPRSAIPDFIGRAEEISARNGVLVVPVGHAGDGNIHCFIVRLKQSDGEWPLVLEATISDLIDLSLSMGGTVSGEHGLGYTKRKYLVKRVGRTQVEVMKAVKRAFDPLNILNPDKVWE
jgi:glycolate oxidase